MRWVFGIEAGPSLFSCADERSQRREMLHIIKHLLPIPVKDMLKGSFFKKIVKKLRISDQDLWVIENATFKDDGMITAHNSDFLNDPLFLEAYKLGKHTTNPNFDIHWRAYIACWAAQRGKLLEGDFVECGVNRGIFSRAIMHYIDFKNLNDRKFYLLDTFCGFPARYKHLAPEINHNEYSECYNEVQKTFKDFENCILIRGVIPDTLPLVVSKKICYLSIDMNCAEPEIASAEYFWDKLVSGAVIVLDDYGYSQHYERQTKAFNEFAQRKEVKILSLPTGQGLIFKP